MGISFRRLFPGGSPTSELSACCLHGDLVPPPPPYPQCGRSCHICCGCHLEGLPRSFSSSDPRYNWRNSGIKILFNIVQLACFSIMLQLFNLLYWHLPVFTSGNGWIAANAESCPRAKLVNLNIDLIAMFWVFFPPNHWLNCLHQSLGLSFSHCK